MRTSRCDPGPDERAHYGQADAQPHARQRAHRMMMKPVDGRAVSQVQHDTERLRAGGPAAVVSHALEEEKGSESVGGEDLIAIPA